MFTRASRLFLGLGVTALISALVYGVITNGGEKGVIKTLTGSGAVNALIGPLTLGYKGGVGERVGYSVLLGAAVCLIFLGALCLAFRDADPESLDQLSGSGTAPAIPVVQGASIWPLIFAFGVAGAVIGLAVNMLYFYVGLAVIAIAGVEWMVKAWSESATGDAEVNRQIRARVMHPFELPIGGLLLGGVVIFGASQIFLSSTENAAIIWGTVLGLVVFGAAIALAGRQQIKRGTILAVVVIGALLLLALGIFGAVSGWQPVEKKEAQRSSVVSPYSEGAASTLGVAK